MNKKTHKRIKLKKKIRGKVTGSSARPRLSVFKSNKEIYAQLVDDAARKTLVSVATLGKNGKSFKGTKTEKAKAIGIALAKKAVEKGIKEVVFDRNGFLYHGRVKALADGARESGLKF